VAPPERLAPIERNKRPYLKPIVFPSGSTNQADSAKPTSATPSICLEAGLVVLGNLDASSAQLGNLRRDIGDTPTRLGRPEPIDLGEHDRQDRDPEHPADFAEGAVRPRRDDAPSGATPAASYMRRVD
jgi:hypothetical protein